MDKNTIIGFVLIVAVLIGFSMWNTPSDEEQSRLREQLRRDSIAAVDNQRHSLENEHNNTLTNTQKEDSEDFWGITDRTDSLTAKEQVVVEEQLFALENAKIKLDISTKGGQIASAQIKNDSKYTGDSLYLFNKDASLDLALITKKGKSIMTGDLDFKKVKSGNPNSVVMRHSVSDNKYIDFVYSLSEDDYMVKFGINLVGMQDVLSRERQNLFELQVTQKMSRLENNRKNEQRYSSIYYKYVGNDVEELDANKGESKDITEPLKWIAIKNQFFASIFIADDKIDYGAVDSKILENENYLKACQARMFTTAKFGAKDDVTSTGYSIYFGPMSYTHLKQYDDNIKEEAHQLDLDKLVPLGWALFRWVNQFFVIPLFNFLQSSGLSMGIVILLLTIIVKLIIAPLTYKSFMSSAKMRVLKPQVDALNAKFPKQEQAAEKQQAVMALYSRAGANPMSGCVPILLQMPILIALFQFFPNAIELRHQSFLWAHDLSTFDSIWSLPEAIPLIGGTHLSLFCILMTVTNIVYTKFNMEATNTGQQQMPGMKWMMYLMPLIFFFVLNDYPAGLTYYYFVSLLITIILTLIFRFTVNEEKVLAKLEANKAKPKKKSGFMARLEEAQRVQQQQMREQAKKGKKK